MRLLLLVLFAFFATDSVAQPDSLPPAPYKVEYKTINPGQDFVSSALVLTDSTGATTQLAKCSAHDRKGPYYHWLNDSLILYEYCNNSSYERIRVMNVYHKSVVLEKRGYVQIIGDNRPPRNLDTLNRKLIYFTPEDKTDRFFIKVLNLDNLKTTVLIPLETSGGLFGIPYCEKINPRTRKVTIQYDSPEHTFKTIVVKY